MVGYPKREKGTRRNHCNFWGKGGRKCADWRGNGAGGSPNSSGEQQAERMVMRPAPIIFPEESPLQATACANLAVRKPIGAERDLPSHGFLADFRCPKVSKGRAESPLVRPQTQASFFDEGLTRRLRRGSRACSPMRRSHFSFDGERKVCKRKPAARHYGKKALIAHFDGGARNVARNGVGQLTRKGGARSCSPFSAVKMGGPFSLRCLSPLCSPAGGVGQPQTVRVGMLRRSLDIFTTQKTSVISNPRWPF